MNKLTAKQARFVSEYLIDLNATQAAIRAGYAKSGAGVEGVRLLANAKVAEAIALGRAKQERRAEIKADDVIRELVKIGFANMLDYITIGKDGDPYVDLSSLTREQAAAIGEVTVEDSSTAGAKMPGVSARSNSSWPTSAALWSISAGTSRCSRTRPWST